MLVVFTGKDTKQILNEGKYKFKQSQVDKVINIFLAWNIFIMIVCLGVPLAVQAARFVSSHRVGHEYLELEDSSVAS